jgi:peptide-methionine (R)-S-oxide reductase
MTHPRDYIVNTYGNNLHYSGVDRSLLSNPCWTPPHDQLYDCNSNSNSNNNNPTLEGNIISKNKEAFLKGQNLGPVINLSSFKLTLEMINLLSKGLNFCPSPGTPERVQLRQDLDKFHVSLRRKLFFEKRFDSTLTDNSSLIPPDEPSDSDEEGPFDHYKFKNPSKWNPPAPTQLEAFITVNETNLNEYVFPSPSPSNLTNRERTALAELTKASNIIIKPADKGSAVVIQDLCDYIDEGLRQLSDSKFYIETNTDLTHFHNEIVTSLVNYLEEQGEISRKCSRYLQNSNPRTSELYLLPKVHKNKLPMPGRPIVSANNSPTERISEFADFFLKPLVQKTRSYVRDTTDFINKIESITTLPAECYLCTVDVTSLYTNIPNDEGVTACTNILNKYRTGSLIPSNENIARVLEHVLYMNNFNFNGKHYLQVGGTAMGTRVAPSFANIFMADFEERYVYNYHTQPLVWLRYIDDIFMVWNHNRESLDSFLKYLNECHHSIKFTSEISDSQINFLDTTVHIDMERKLYTDLYCKPTDAHNYLLYSSAHPKHLLKSLPYSQLLRIRRICSRIEDFDKNALEIGQHFLRREYPEEIILNAIIKARRMDRTQLLAPKAPIDNNDKKDLFVITQFNPDSSALKEIVHTNWSVLGRTHTTEYIFQKKPTFGYRRNENLKDKLVHAKIPPQPPPNSVLEHRQAERKCKSKSCRYCPRLVNEGKVTNPVTKQEYYIKHQITCNSNNLIYCIRCTNCNIMYVGQTKNTIKERFLAHFYSINNPKKSDTTVGRHFSKANHQGILDTSILVLEFIKAPPNTPAAQRLRDEKELMWIHRLSTIAPIGLNSAD